MCTLSEFMEKLEFVSQNQWMKDYLASPPKEGDSMFYQQNTVNKTLTLPFYRKTDAYGKKCGCYRNRSGKCFPASAPICCPPMLYRTKASARPRSPTDVQLPSHRTLIDNFTMKLEKKTLKIDE